MDVRCVVSILGERNLQSLCLCRPFVPFSPEGGPPIRHRRIFARFTEQVLRSARCADFVYLQYKCLSAVEIKKA